MSLLSISPVATRLAGGHQSVWPLAEFLIIHGVIHLLNQQVCSQNMQALSYLAANEMNWDHEKTHILGLLKIPTGKWFFAAWYTAIRYIVVKIIC